MRLEGRSLNKGSMMSSCNNRKKPYGLLLLVALGAALLSVVVLHKLRESRVLGLLVQDRESQLLTLHILLKKERDKSKEIKSRLDQLRDKTISLNHQKDELYNKLMEKEIAIDDLKRIQKEMEASLEEKEEQINQITRNAGECQGSNRRQVSSLTELLKQKEAEIEEMKRQAPQPIHSTAQEEMISNMTTDLVENEILRDTSLATTAVPTGSTSSEADTHVGDDANDTAATSQHVNSTKDTWVSLETIIEEDQVLKEDNVSSAEDNSLKEMHVSQGIEDAGKGGQVVKKEEKIEKLTSEESNFATADIILNSNESIIEHDAVPQEEKSATRAETVDSSTMDNDTEEQVITSDQPLQLAQLLQDSTGAGSGNSDENEETTRPSEHKTISQEDEKSVTRAEAEDSSITVDFDSKDQVIASDQPQKLAQLTQDSTDAGSGNSDEKEETTRPSEHKTISQEDEKSVTRAEAEDSSITVDFDSKDQVIASDQPQKLAQLTQDSTDAGRGNSDEKEETTRPSEHKTISQEDEKSVTRAEAENSNITVDFDSKDQVIASDQPQKLAQLKQDSTDAGSSYSDQKEETIHPSATN